LAFGLGGSASVVGHRNDNFARHTVTDWRIATVSVRHDTDYYAHIEGDNMNNIDVSFEGAPMQLTLSGGRLFTLSGTSEVTESSRVDAALMAIS
jgi:hypothetical protein